jgi:predicted phage terminase large subunit-like protein
MGMNDVSLSRDAVDAILWRDFYAFFERAFEELHPDMDLVEGWHLKAICHECIKVWGGRTRRLLVTLPPRHLKSVIITVAFAAWWLGHNPAKRIMVVSYGETLIAEHSAQFRKLVTASWYRRIFPQMVVARNTDEVVTTTAGGSRRATTIRGAQTGLGADLIILDDAMKAQEARSANEREVVEETYRGSIITRLNEKKTAAIICVGQRLHEDDLPGRLIESGQYAHLCLPAIAMEATQHDLGGGEVYVRQVGEVLCEAREDREALEEMRIAMGNGNFEAQYQQNPGVSDDAQLRWEEVHTYDEAPRRHELEYVVLSVDTGQTAKPTSDYSVGITFGYKAPHWYVLDVIRGQWVFPELQARVLAARKLWRPDMILIEQGGSGTPLVHLLMQERSIALQCGRAVTWNVRGVIPRGPKPERFAAGLGTIKEGVLLFALRASHQPALRRELERFPDPGGNDDQVDAISQFLTWAVNRGFERKRILGEPLAATTRRNIPRREVERRIVVRR